jgi:phospholipid transport system substrate-binding protein
MKIYNKVILVFSAVFLLLNVSFAASSPIPTMQATADKVIAALKSNQAKLKNNPAIANGIVTKYLLPLVDERSMAQAVLGRTAWNSATAAQQNEFIQQFRILVVRTYAAAFSSFTNESVQFKPVRGNLASQSFIQVQSNIISKERPPIAVNYSLAQQNSGWKIIDFSVEGVSMVQSFHSQFASQLSSSGVAGLIKALKAHNNQ